MRKLWEEKGGALGVGNKLGRELANQQRAVFGDAGYRGTVQVLKIIAHEDIFQEGQNGLWREVAAVGRVLHTSTKYGPWYLCVDEIQPAKAKRDVSENDGTLLVANIRARNDDTIAGNIYFKLETRPMVEEAQQAEVVDAEREQDRTDAADVKACFDRIGNKVAETLRERNGELVIALAGACGVGKSTELPKVIHS